MTEAFFPDNTVLCNFAAVDRVDLLRSVLSERGRWTEAVAYEASRSAAHLRALASLAADGWLGEPVEVTSDADIQAIERIRRAAFGGTDDRPLQHLGEAQTCYVIKHWADFSGSWWITDDREALRYAKFQGITTRETIDLMSMAVVNGDIGAQDAFSLMTLMADRDRGLRLPKTASDFTK
jgi:predicted nucleic acid-binding protein